VDSSLVERRQRACIAEREDLNLQLKSPIRKNIETASSAKTIAAALDVNVDTLRKEFYQKEGIAISRFLDDVRLERVKTLLLETAMSCLEIALCMHQREDSLARWFKRRTEAKESEKNNVSRKCQPQVSRESCCVLGGMTPYSHGVTNKPVNDHTITRRDAL